MEQIEQSNGQEEVQAVEEEHAFEQENVIDLSALDNLQIYGPSPGSGENDDGGDYAVVNGDGIIAEFFKVVGDENKTVNSRTNAVMFAHSLQFLNALLEISYALRTKANEIADGEFFDFLNEMDNKITRVMIPLLGDITESIFDDEEE